MGNSRNHFFIKKTIAIAAALLLLVLAAGSVWGEPQKVEDPAALPEISAQVAVLMESSTGRILYEKNKDQKAYPASTTKIMTALLAVEAGNLDEKVKVPAKAAGVEGSSIYLESGEELPFRDLVYGLMLRSGNDAAVAIAEKVGGGTEAFIQMMNSRAKEIGAENTNFLNPNGLYDENHYTTAYDMALMAREAMQNPEFREVAGARSWQAHRGAGKYNFFSNKNKVVYEYSGGNGIKIGYTKSSGRTLVASSQRNGMELICVVMNAPNWFEDSYKLMNYGYENFEMIRIAEGQRILKAEPLTRGEKDHVFIGPKEDILCPVRKGTAAEKMPEQARTLGQQAEGQEQVTLEYEDGPVTKAPVARWQEAGALKIYLNGEFLCRKPLYYLEDIGREQKD